MPTHFTTTITYTNTTDIGWFRGTADRYLPSRKKVECENCTSKVTVRSSDGYKCPICGTKYPKEKL